MCEVAELPVTGGTAGQRGQSACQACGCIPTRRNHPRNVKTVALKWLITKGRNPEHRGTRTSGLYCSCIYEAAVHTVQGDDTEGKPLRSIKVRLELSVLDVQLRVRC